MVLNGVAMNLSHQANRKCTINSSGSVWYIWNFTDFWLWWLWRYPYSQWHPGIAPPFDSKNHGVLWCPLEVTFTGYAKATIIYTFCFYIVQGGLVSSKVKWTNDEIMFCNTNRNASYILHALLDKAQTSYIIGYDGYDDIHMPRVMLWCSTTIWQK